MKRQEIIDYIDNQRINKTLSEKQLNLIMYAFRTNIVNFTQVMLTAGIMDIDTITFKRAILMIMEMKFNLPTIEV